MEVNIVESLKPCLKKKRRDPLIEIRRSTHHIKQTACYMRSCVILYIMACCIENIFVFLFSFLLQDSAFWLLHRSLTFSLGVNSQWTHLLLDEDTIIEEASCINASLVFTRRLASSCSSTVLPIKGSRSLIFGRRIVWRLSLMLRCNNLHRETKRLRSICFWHLKFHEGRTWWFMRF